MEFSSTGSAAPSEGREALHGSINIKFQEVLLLSSKDSYFDILNAFSVHLLKLP